MPSLRAKLIIGVSGGSSQSKSVRAMMKQIRDEGATALFLSSHARLSPSFIEKDLAKIDALVLMGNVFDIDPSCYIRRYPKGHSRRCVHPQTRSEYATIKGKARARYEDALIRKALVCGMPLLGICGGMQRINVVCGGTLHQHLPDLVGCDKHRQQNQGIAPHIPVVPVIIKENTLLATIANGIKMPFVKGSSTMTKVIMENSMHHQAVDRVAEGLHVSAITDTIRLRNGTTGYLAEAIETDNEGVYAGKCILGVQWHPEFGASSLGQKIVQHMIGAARTFSRKKRRKLIFSKVYSLQKL